MRCWGRDTGRSPTLTPTILSYHQSHRRTDKRDTVSVHRPYRYIPTYWESTTMTYQFRYMSKSLHGERIFWMWEIYVVLKFRSIFHAAPTIYWHLILFVIMRKSFPISIFLTSRRCKFSHLHLHSRAWWPSLQNHIITINIVHPTCITNHAATERSWTNKPWTSVRACKSGRPSTERWRRWRQW